MTPSPSPVPAGRPPRCWCGHESLEDFSADYRRCPACETLVVRAMPSEEISRVRDDEQDFYGKNYYLRHIQEDYGLPDLETRARADLPERCLHWLRTLLRFVPGAGARTLELGCGHGGFVALQRWAGLDATGLELSPWLVRRAREWFDAPVLEGRLEDQELAAGSCDAVILIDVLEHLPDPRQTLQRAVSLLRPDGGFLLIQTPCYPAGASFEALRERNHPFLQQLKPVEHLHLFSERSVQRLCAEVGAGWVRFEPAIFAHYDLYAVASAGPLRERPPAERAAALLGGPPSSRGVLAMLDLADVRDGLQARIAEQAAEYRDLRGHFDGSEADRAARLAVIENQGAEIGRLHAEIDRLRREREIVASLTGQASE
ncbi:MAG: class I SAM-dependent methyltransferase [Gluconacetobacter diazotrophicus]|nr:class I SAM-dependent methyltransferase [Gluconacetobacter diazotrophicus]